MWSNIRILNIFTWLFGITIMIVGLLNIFLVHPVPGIIYLFLSLIYLPPVNNVLLEKLGISIPILLKIVLGVVIFMFTLGVSDLGDMIDKF
jgi:hypothetical protein